jgi:GWxTD domain-containing protein
MRFRWTRRYREVLALFLILALGLASGVAQAAQKNKNGLSKTYNDWLNRDVAYIITKPERKAFLDLASDDARDEFIKRFWSIRNPTPGSPQNTYEDQIYQRIAYANAHFGVGSGGEGWRTDRGRTYITLGPPQQTRKYYGAPNLRPFEIWFYSNVNPSLPSFFYLMFYQPDSMGEFVYYSPYMDGPDKLVSGMEAINDPQTALKIIQESVGPEVTRVAQTFIPSEPLDPSGRIGLQSDIVISTVKNFANTPSNLDALDRRRNMDTNVTGRLIVNANRLDTVVLPVRDSRGLTRLDYAVRLRNPGDLTLTQGEDGHYTYTIEVRVRVFTQAKDLIFTQQKSVTGSFGQRGLDEIEHRPFGYEGILPLPSGKYHLELLITDWAKQVGFRGERDVEIPDNAPSTFVVPALLPFSTAESVDSAKDGTLPFAMAGLRFKPLETAPLLYNPDQVLNVAYQVWAPPKDPQQAAGQNLEVEYAFGQPALAGKTTVLQDSVDMGQFTASGALVNGKKIPLAGEPEGNYLLTVSVSHSGTAQKAYSTLSFQILGDVAADAPWDVDEPEIGSDLSTGVFDQERALCYLAQDNQTEARRWFRVALSKDHGNDIARTHLVQAYYALNAYPAVVSLFNDAGITEHTGSGTVAQIAESFLRTGNASKAVALLQDATRTSPDDASLYLALADCYQQMGKQQEAQEMSRKAESLVKTASPAK